MLSDASVQLADPLLAALCLEEGHTEGRVAWVAQLDQLGARIPKDAGERKAHSHWRMRFRLLQRSWASHTPASEPIVTQTVTETGFSGTMVCACVRVAQGIEILRTLPNAQSSTPGVLQVRSNMYAKFHCPTERLAYETPGRIWH